MRNLLIVEREDNERFKIYLRDIINIIYVKSDFFQLYTSLDNSFVSFYMALILLSRVLISMLD